MTIAGNLRTMSLADIMQWMSSSHKTGTLVIDGSKYTSKVYFRRGNVVAVGSDNPREMLGCYLVGWGYCNESELEYMVELQDHAKVMLGELAVSLGHLTRHQLDEMIIAKTRECIFDLIMWDEGEFRFLDSELPDRTFVEVDLEVSQFLFEGYRQKDERRRMREVIPSSLHIPILISMPDDLNDADMAVALQMDGRLSVHELAWHNHLPEFQVLKLAYDCTNKGVVQIQEPDETKDAPGLSDSPWLELEADIGDRLRRGRYLDALKLLNNARSKYGNENRFNRWLRSMFSLLEEALEEEPINVEDILEPAIELSDLVNLECDPAEGFVLSRISGAYSLEQVLNQLPGENLDNRLIIHNLRRRGLIKIRQATSVRRFKDRAAGRLDEVTEWPEDQPFSLDE